MTNMHEDGLIIYYTGFLIISEYVCLHSVLVLAVVYISIVYAWHPHLL